MPAANDNWPFTPPKSVSFWPGDRRHAYLYQTCGGLTATLCGLVLPNRTAVRGPRDCDCRDCLDAAIVANDEACQHLDPVWLNRLYIMSGQPLEDERGVA